MKIRLNLGLPSSWEEPSQRLKSKFFQKFYHSRLSGVIVAIYLFLFFIEYSWFTILVSDMQYSDSVWFIYILWDYMCIK